MSTDGLSAAQAARLLDPQRRQAFVEALGRLVAAAVLRDLAGETQATSQGEKAKPKARRGSEPHRSALSLRAIEREYGLSRTFLREQVRTGALPALRRGRSVLVLRRDVEMLWTIAPSHAERVVAKILAREAGKKEKR